jgi:hypothetical protein
MADGGTWVASARQSWRHWEDGTSTVISSADVCAVGTVTDRRDNLGVCHDDPDAPMAYDQVVSGVRSRVSGSVRMFIERQSAHEMGGGQALGRIGRSSTGGSSGNVGTGWNTARHQWNTWQPAALRRRLRRCVFRETRARVALPADRRRSGMRTPAWAARGGMQYRGGDTFPSIDSCNTCSCSDVGVACTSARAFRRPVQTLPRAPTPQSAGFACGAH